MLCQTCLGQRGVIDAETGGFVLCPACGGQGTLATDRVRHEAILQRAQRVVAEHPGAGPETVERAILDALRGDGLLD
jgi:DnaJ-class molecular chaperone